MLKFSHGAPMRKSRVWANMMQVAGPDVQRVCRPLALAAGHIWPLERHASAGGAGRHGLDLLQPPGQTGKATAEGTVK